LEIIVVDDHSTDGSFEHVQSLTDERIKLYRNARKGANLAREQGVSLASGAYILFSDADDTWEPGAVAALAARAQQDGSDMVVGNLNLVAQDGSKSRFKYIALPEVAGAVDIVQAPRYINAINPNAVAKLFQRDIVASLQFSNVRFTQDWNITYQAVANSRLVSFLNVGVYNYIRREESITTTKGNFTIDPLLLSLNSFTDVMSHLKRKGRGRAVEAEFSVLHLKFLFTFLIKALVLPSAERKKFHRAVKQLFYHFTPLGRVVPFTLREFPQVLLILAGILSYSVYDKLFPAIKRKISIDR
jgi:glycosyltransferase involved in cell wall biosynthesis